MLLLLVIAAIALFVLSPYYSILWGAIFLFASIGLGEQSLYPAILFLWLGGGGVWTTVKFLSGGPFLWQRKRTQGRDTDHVPIPEVRISQIEVPEPVPPRVTPPHRIEPVRTLDLDPTRLSNLSQALSTITITFQQRPNAEQLLTMLESDCQRVLVWEAYQDDGLTRAHAQLMQFISLTPLDLENASSILRNTPLNDPYAKGALLSSYVTVLVAERDGLYNLREAANQAFSELVWLSAEASDDRVPCRGLRSSMMQLALIRMKLILALNARETADPQSQARQVLGLSDDCTSEQVKAAYRERVKQWHPDLLAHSAPEEQVLATEQMTRINAAYQVLTNSTDA